MCLAIYKPAGKSIPDEYFTAGFDNNSNGAGFCWYNGEKLLYCKGLMTIEAFLETYHLYITEDVPALIHFRFATIGPRDAAHTHPFITADGSCLIHNGPQIADLGDSSMSDTRDFVENVINALSFDLLKASEKLVEGYLEGNKVLVMSPTGEVVIFNEDRGHWKDGVWYSNDGYHDWKYSTYMGKRYGLDDMSDYDWKDWKYGGAYGAINQADKNSWENEGGIVVPTTLDEKEQREMDIAAENAFENGLSEMMTLNDLYYAEENLDASNYFEAFDTYFYHDRSTGQYVELGNLMTYANFRRMELETEFEYTRETAFEYTPLVIPPTKKDNILVLPHPPQPPPTLSLVPLEKEHVVHRATG